MGRSYTASCCVHLSTKGPIFWQAHLAVHTFPEVFQIPLLRQGIRLYFLETGLVADRTFFGSYADIRGKHWVCFRKPSNNTQYEVKDAALSIHDAGTGLMCIKRAVFEKMVEAYPELKFRDDTGSLNEEERNWTYAFFNSYIDDDGRFLSEDYGFGRYWQKIGGKIWVDPGINIKHLGRLNFEGSMIDQLVDMSNEMSPKQLP